MSRQVHRKAALRFWLAVAGAAMVAAPGWGAPRERADLYLQVNARGAARVFLRLDPQPPRSLPLEQVIGQALGGTLRDIERDAEEDEWTLDARCDNAFRRRGWLVEGQIDPDPLLRLLRPLHVQWLTINITHPRVAFSRCPGARAVATGRRSTVDYFYPVLVATGSPPLRLAFGYRRGDWLSTIAPLAALLFLPIGLTLRMRRSALRAPSADPAAVWFRYARFLQYVSIAAIPVWAAAVLGLHAEDLASFALGRAPDEAGATVTFVCVVLPPVLVLVLCSFLSQPVYARVRGIEWTRSELAQRSVWPLAAGIVPILLVMAGVDAELHGQPQAMVLYFLAALVTRTLSLRGWTKALGMTPNALTVGELRDRIFALAGQAGVKVQQVYVLPAGKGRLANAFAMRGNNVLITDYLLEHLSKREIDAIMAHELAHLKRRDPGKLRGALVLFIATPVGVYLGLSSFTDLNVGPWALPVVMALALMAFYFFSRRRERGADAGAVALTGDAEALITGLAKITALNLMPLQWGKWDERFLTHPSTLRRVQSIAQQSGISPERLQEILESSSSEGERYALPSEERLFSTTFKTQVLAGISWALTAVIVLTPALAAYLITRAGWEGLAKEAAYLGGLTATLACYLAAGNYALLWGCRGLQRRLRERMEREGVMPEREDGLFVGFAPASSPRLYEGFSDWDIGFLFIEEDRLCYLGEQVRFALRRDQVSAIQLGPGGPGWWREPRIYVTWRSEECGAGGIFNLSATSARSVRQLGRETRALARQLRAWSEQPSPLAGVPSSLPELGAPAVGGVTSVSPRTLINGRVVLWSMLVMAALAAGVSVLMSLPFDPDQGGAAWYVIAVTTVASIFQWWPYLIYREPDSAKKATIPAPDAPEV